MAHVVYVEGPTNQPYVLLERVLALVAASMAIILEIVHARQWEREDQCNK